MKSNELRSVMAKIGDSQRSLAKVIGITEQAFSNKINERNGAEFTQTEIAKIKERYSLNADQVDDIFFSTKVS